MQLFEKAWRTLAVALAMSVLAAASSAAGASDASNADEGVRAAVASGQSARVIMQFATTAERDAAFNRLLDRGAAVRAVDTEAGPALVVFGSAASFRGEMSSATRVSLDAGVRVLAAPARDTSARKSTGIGSAPATVTASRNGISVAIIDSGIAPHRDLPLSRIRAYKDFVGDGGRMPVDTCGHGTHVAGIVAGNGAGSNGIYAGIAPDVDIVALRVLGGDCTGNTSDVIDALEWIARHHEIYKIRVVNISLGHAVLESIFTDPFVQAVERLSRKGIAIVTAAGNEGQDDDTNIRYGGVGVPCNAPSAICVGSLDTLGTPDLTDDRVADSSSRGPTRFDLLAKPDLLAPGVNIVSLAARGSYLFNKYENLRVPGANGRPDYFTLSGTSMASPVVAGTAALLLRDNHALSVHALKISLQFTARLLPLTDVLSQGAGTVNIPGALTLADAINPNVPRGTTWIRHRLTAANRDASGNTINWSRRIIYGDRFVRPRYAELHLFRWDDDIVWAYDGIAAGIDWDDQSGGVVWGNDDNIVWGNGDNIVWGNDDNIVWGNQADDNIVWGNDESDNRVFGIDDNIVWGNADNIVWGNSDDDNIVWGNNHLRHIWASRVLPGFWDDTVAWGSITRDAMDNIVWGNGFDNIVWGNCSAANNIVWGNRAPGDDNIVWGNRHGHTVKGKDDDNIVWGNCDDNIVWGNQADNIVWGNRPAGGRR